MSTEYCKSIVDLEFSIIKTIMTSPTFKQVFIIDKEAYFKKKIVELCQAVKHDRVAMEYLRGKIEKHYDCYLDWYDKISVLL